MMLVILNSNPFHEIRNQIPKQFINRVSISLFFPSQIGMNRLNDMHDGTDVFFFILIFMNEKGSQYPEANL